MSLHRILHKVLGLQMYYFPIYMRFQVTILKNLICEKYVKKLRCFVIFCNKCLNTVYIFFHFS